MNAILFHTDQHRADSLGCYGNRGCQTPHLDQLANEGVRFSQAFTPTAICAPARAAFQCGQFPMRNGIIVNPESGLAGGQDFHQTHQWTMGQALKEAGVSATHLGKWHIGTALSPADCGYAGPFFRGYGEPREHEDYLKYLKAEGISMKGIKAEVKGKTGFLLSALLDGPVEASVPYYLAERAITELERAAKNNTPFFLRLDFWGPHLPYILPEPYYSMYKPEEMTPWPAFEDSLDGKPWLVNDYKRYWGVDDFTWEDWARQMAGYFGYATLIDEQIGRVRQAADDLGLLKDTALFFTTDHGGMVGSRGLCDKGPFMVDECYRIPMVGWRPGTFQQGAVDDAFVYHFDLMPTILETMGVAVPEGLDAVSLLPNLTGKGSGRKDEYVVCEFHGHQAPAEQRMVRSRTHKYIYNGSDRDEFYDLEKDPLEMDNRIDGVQEQPAIQAMRQQLADWMVSVGDPSLKYFRTLI
jgi:arylsulfatase A-like enzyme